MTQVLFIQLFSPGKALHCLRLARLFSERGKRLVIAVEDEEQAQQLDRFLWVREKLSFIPHRLWRGEDADFTEALERVLITVGVPESCRADVLVMVAPCAVEEAARFRLVFDFAETYDEQLRALSRERFGTFRDAGFQPRMWTERVVVEVAFGELFS